MSWSFAIQLGLGGLTLELLKKRKIFSWPKTGRDPFDQKLENKVRNWLKFDF
jgi:hypothetical protein